MTVHFLITGDIQSLTGGYLYNMHMINGLRGKGHLVNVFGTDWQWKDSDSLEYICRHHLKKLPHGSCVIVDSLILASLHHIVQEFGDRLKFLGLIHLPASYNVLSGVHGKLADEELTAINDMRQVIVTGQFTFDLLCNVGLNPARICLVEPGTDHFPRKKRYKPVPSELLCIANYSALKAQDVLIRALCRLTAWNWSLHLYGDTNRDKKYTEALRSLIRQLKMEHRIIVHGIVERHEISTVFLNADLFLMPSLFESYGMAITESLAHGIPVVTTSAGNIPYTLPAGMGLLTEPGNEEQLADTIRSIFYDPVKYDALCKAASQYFKQVRSWEQAVSDFETILQKMMNDEI
jgi:glycosyltransferase involved in cell wall biosynthesis